MGFVIRIDWLGSMVRGEPSEHAGRYVSRYDPDAHDGLGQVWTVADPQVALQFKSHAKAVSFYRQASTVKPVRKDGRPNRPLTAFTVSIYDWETAINDIPEPYRSAHAAAFRSKEQLLASRWVGCFYCGLIYAPKSIRKWIDDGQTAMCPACGIDSVLPMTVEQFDSDFLQQMHYHWFGDGDNESGE